MRRAGRAAATLLLLLSADAAAQAYSLALPGPLEQAPAMVLNHSPAAALQAAAYDHEMLDGYSKRRAHGVAPVVQQERWMLYGRLGLLRFRNDFDPHGAGAQVLWRNSGPGTSGRKLYIGFQRRF